MVKPGLAEEVAQLAPEPKPDPRFDMDELWKRHEEYWSHEAVEQRARFERDMGGLHIEDGFRIVCDGQVAGRDCGNVIGRADTFKFDTHDGLCEACRIGYAMFPPRVHMTADGIYAMLFDGPGVLPRPWKYPEEAKDGR